MSGKSNQERITESQEEIESLESEIDSLKDKAESIEATLDEKRNFLDKIDSLKEDSKQKFESIKSTKKQVDKKKKEIDKLKKEIKEVKSSLDDELKESEVKKEEIDKFFIKVFGEEKENGKREGGLKKRLETKEEEIDNLLKEKETEIDNFLENKKEEIEEFLEQNNKDFNNLKEKINSLLPGAAATGLAKAYYDQKGDYKTPKLVWGTSFAIAIIGIIVTGAAEYGQISDISAALESFIVKLPFLVAFIWLGTFSARRYKENKRLEEEYAHKEALAKTYMGYKDEDFSNNKKASEALDEALIDAFSKNPGELLDDVSENDRPGIVESLSNSVNGRPN